MPKQLIKTILLSRGRNYRIIPKWYIIYLQTVASNVFQSVKLFFSCCVRPSFRFIPFKLTQDWTSNNINLWKKINIDNDQSIWNSINSYIYIYIYNTDTYNCSTTSKKYQPTQWWWFQKVWNSVVYLSCLVV